MSFNHLSELLVGNIDSDGDDEMAEVSQAFKFFGTNIHDHIGFNLADERQKLGYPEAIIPIEKPVNHLDEVNYDQGDKNTELEPNNLPRLEFLRSNKAFRVKRKRKNASRKKIRCGSTKVSRNKKPILILVTLIPILQFLINTESGKNKFT